MLRGLGALGGWALAGGTVTACSGSPPVRTAAQFLTGRRYFVAHRGAGDEAPEHTMASYTRVVDRGAEAIEISVHRTSDGVLVCHHDATLGRTCNGFDAAIKDLSYDALAQQRIDMTRHVGPGWGTHPIPRLTDVLDALGNRAILFVEPKDPAAAHDVVREISSRRLAATTVFKQHHMAGHDRVARQAGLAVWNYYGREVAAGDMIRIAERSDAIGAEANEPLVEGQTELVRAAVATGKPVIAWALHRRHVVDELSSLGVRGFMCSSWSYLKEDRPGQRADSFGTGRVAPGDLAIDLTTDSAPVWNSDGSIGLTAGSYPQSLTLGSMGPVRSPSYSLSLQMRFDRLPPRAGLHGGVVIGRRDDRPYRFRAPDSAGGALVILRADGTLELRQIPPDGGQSVLIASRAGEPVVAGRWESIEVQVEGADTIVTRTSVSGATSKLRGTRTADGPYFTLTRNYADPEASLRFREISVVPG